MNKIDINNLLDKLSAINIKKQSHYIVVKIIAVECRKIAKRTLISSDISYLDLVNIIKKKFEREIRLYLIGNQRIVKFLPLLKYYDGEDMCTIDNNQDLYYFLNYSDHLSDCNNKCRKLYCYIPSVWRNNNGKNVPSHINGAYENLSNTNTNDTQSRFIDTKNNRSNNVYFKKK